MKKTIRIGLVGGGWPAWQHIKGFKKLKNVRVEALCDVNKEHLNKIANEYNIPKRFTKFEEILNEKEIDAVCVCTPNYLHVPQAILSLKAGKHVLCEKPLSVNAKEGQKIKPYLKKAGKVFMMAHVYRFKEESRYLKSLITKGELDSIYFARTHVLRREGIPGWGGWFTTKSKSGGGALIDCGVHMLDLTWWLMGTPNPVSAYGVTYAKFGPKGLRKQKFGVSKIKGKPIFDVDDCAIGLIRMANGSSLLIEVSWALNIKEIRDINCSWFGIKGGVDYNPIKSPKEFPVEIMKYPKNKSKIIRPKFGESNMFDNQAGYFIDCIRNNKKPSVPLEDGITVMKMLDAIYESAKIGRSVPIK
jgi:predicted dehydrogenase